MQAVAAPGRRVEPWEVDGWSPADVSGVLLEAEAPKPGESGEWGAAPEGIGCSSGGAGVDGGR